MTVSSDAFRACHLSCISEEAGKPPAPLGRCSQSRRRDCSRRRYAPASPQRDAAKREPAVVGESYVRIAKPRGAAPESRLPKTPGGTGQHRIMAAIMRRSPFRHTPALPPGRKVRLLPSPHFSTFRQPYGLKHKALCSLGDALGRVDGSPWSGQPPQPTACRPELRYLEERPTSLEGESPHPIPLCRNIILRQNSG